METGQNNRDQAVAIALKAFEENALREAVAVSTPPAEAGITLRSMFRGTTTFRALARKIATLLPRVAPRRESKLLRKLRHFQRQKACLSPAENHLQHPSSTTSVPPRANPSERRGMPSRFTAPIPLTSRLKHLVLGKWGTKDKSPRRKREHRFRRDLRYDQSFVAESAEPRLMAGSLAGPNILTVIDGVEGNEDWTMGLPEIVALGNSQAVPQTSEAPHAASSSTNHTEPIASNVTLPANAETTAQAIQSLQETGEFNPEEDIGLPFLSSDSTSSAWNPLNPDVTEALLFQLAELQQLFASRNALDTVAPKTLIAPLALEPTSAQTDSQIDPSLLAGDSQTSNSEPTTTGSGSTPQTISPVTNPQSSPTGDSPGNRDPPPDPPPPGLIRMACSGWTLVESGGSESGRGSFTSESGSLALREGDSFLVSIQRAFTIPPNPATLTFTLDELTFDTTDPDFINDAFEAAFLDASGISLVPVIASSRDSFFNATEGEPVALGSKTTFSDPTVTLNISSLPAGSTGILALRLVNNDSDVNTLARIHCNTPPQVTANDGAANEGQSLEFVGTFIDPDIGDTHTALISWGDNTTSEGVVTATQDGGTVTASHVYADNGNYTITLTVSDNNEGVGSDSATATIANVAPAVTVGPNQTHKDKELALDFTIGTFSDPGFTSPTAGTEETFTALIDWGDGTTPSEGTLTVVQGSEGVLTTGTVTANHVYQGGGVYTVTLTVTDDDLDSGSASFQITILPTKFFVVDQDRRSTFRYDRDGGFVSESDLGQFDSRPRGVASDSTGDTLWVIDANKTVYVYTGEGALLGSWQDPGLNQPQDITTDGTDIWIIDTPDNVVYRYSGAASRRSGSQAPDASFPLVVEDRNPTGLVTDGSTFWVTDNFDHLNKVFVYDMTGQLLGSWLLDPLNVDPSGITLNPNGGSDLWVVDRLRNAVFHYAESQDVRSGSLLVTDTFALANNNRHPEGIADPEVFWNVDSDGFWDDAANWDTGTVPSPTDDVIIDRPTANPTVTIRFGAQSVNSVTSHEALVLSGGTLSVAAPSEVNNTFTLSGGDLTGAGPFTINNTMDWIAGRLVSGGTLVIANTATLNLINSNDKDVVGSTLNNFGTANWNTGRIRTGSGSLIANSGLWIAQANNQISNDYGNAQSTFSNSGSFQHIGSSSSHIFIVYDNNGSTDATNGTLHLRAGGTSSGSFNAASPGALFFGEGTHILNASSSVSGSGTVGIFSGSTIVNGTWSVSGITDLQGGTIAFNTAASTATGIFRGSDLAGSDSLTVTDTMDWSSGRIVSGGTLIIANTATLNLINSNDKDVVGSTLNNFGAVNWFVGRIRTGSGSLISNSGLWIAQANNQISNDYGNAQSTFSNSGSFQHSGSGDSHIFIVYDNNGSTDVTSGTLHLRGGGNSSGSFNAPTPGRLLFGEGTHTLSASSSISGSGTLGIFSGSAVVNGSWTVSGITDLQGGTISFNTAASTVTGIFRGSDLAGSGSLTVSNAMDWSSGRVVSGGTLIIANTATLNLINSNDKDVVGSTLNNFGTVNWNAGRIRTGSDSLIANSGLWIAQANNQISNDYGNAQSTFSNSGSFQHSGSGDSHIFIVFDNNGSTDVTSGTLHLRGGGNSSGSFNAPTPGRLLFGEGTHTFSASSSVSGSGTLGIFSGSAIVNGSWMVSGITDLQGGTIAFNTAASTITGIFRGSDLTGTGSLTVSNTMDWSSGRIVSGGTLTIANTATLSLINNNDKDIVGSTLANFGTVNWLAGRIRTGSGALISNSGLWIAQANNQISNDYGNAQSTFSNSGGFQHSGSGDSHIFIVYDNNGSTDVPSGTLHLRGGGNSSGSFSTTSPSALFFGEGTHTLTATSSVSGSGTVGIFSGSAIVNGSWVVSGTTDLQGGTIAFNTAASTVTGIFRGSDLTGSDSLTVTDTMDWQRGRVVSGGTLVIANTATLNLINSNDKDIVGSTLSNFGTVNWNAGRIRTGSGALIANNGLWTAQANNQISNDYGNAQSTFSNFGSFQHTGTSSSHIFIVYDNDGSTQVTSGTLHLRGGGNSSGSFNATSPGALFFGEGTHTLSATSSVTGSGTLGIFTGSTVVNGSWTVSGTTDLQGGTISFNTAATTVNALLRGSDVAGSGSLTVSGTMSWTAGRIVNGATLIGTHGATLNLIGGNEDIVGSTLNNDGTVNWTSGRIRTGFGTHINNDGLWIAQANNAIVNDYGGAQSTFSNSGIFRQQGSGTTTIAIDFINFGSVEILTGTLSFTGAYTQTGGVTALEGGSLSSTQTLTIQGGVLTGIGTIFANVVNGGELGPGASIGMDVGILNLAGNYTQTTTGSLHIQLFDVGAGIGFDQFRVAGAVTLEGGINLALESTIPLSGEIIFLDNDATDGVTGTFVGLPQNTFVMLNDDLYQLSYSGGSGNDVSLQRVVGITITNVSLPEGDLGITDFIFTVSLDQPGTTSLTLDYATKDGTATSAHDYVATTGSLTFAPGEVTKPITVPVNGDNASATDETFFVEIVNRILVFSPNTTRIGIGTILNDDNELYDAEERFLFTTTEDFHEGTLSSNLTATQVPDEMGLMAQFPFFPYVNIAASARGTIIRLDANTGEILGEYLTAPDGMGRNPSATAVDLLGNVWVANRDESSDGKGSVTRIALVIGGTRGIKNPDGSFTPDPGGQYLQGPFLYSTAIDRDGDGLIKTSFGLGNILAWNNAGGTDSLGGVFTAEDELIINYTRVSGTRTGTVAIDGNNDLWVGGVGDHDHEKISGVTGQPIPGTQFNTGRAGFGGLVDRNGVLWSSNSLIRFVPNVNPPPAGTSASIGNNYGIATDPRTGHIWITNGGIGCSYGLFELDSDGRVLNRYPQPFPSQGVAVDANSHVWVAQMFGSKVWHLAPDPNDPTRHITVGFVTGFHEVNALAVDPNGKIWVAERGNRASRIDPSAGDIGAGGYPVGAIELSVALGLGAGPDNYSDMTGFVSHSLVPQGVWTHTIDGEQDRTGWGVVVVDATIPVGTSMVVQVRAADSLSDLASLPYITIQSGQILHDVAGRFLQLKVTVVSEDDATRPSVQAISIYKLPPPTITVSSPANGERFDAGSSILITGLAASGRPFIAETGTQIPNRIATVTANGTTVEALDLIGNFFTRVTLLPGENVYEFTAYDAFGQSVTATLTLTGVQVTAGDVDFAQLTDVSRSFVSEYGRTSFTESADVLYADLDSIRSIGSFYVDAPFLLGVTNFSDSSVQLADSDGVTPDGIAYYDLSSLVIDGSIAPGELLGSQTLAFFNPNRVRFTYDLVFLGRLNRAPAFTTVPDLSVALGQTYSYLADAADPDVNPLSFSILSGPAAMTIESATGAVTWTPITSDLGTHSITLQVADGRGGFGRQHYLLSVTAVPPNRPPVFTSIPTVVGNVNLTYNYLATATDTDNDALIFSLLSGPQGLSVHANGLVTWTPTADQLGVQNVVLTVSDGHGGDAFQSFAIFVSQEPGNHPPVIVTQPITTGFAGTAYTYDVDALDADNDSLTYSLTTFPAGMTIDGMTGLISWNPTLSDVGNHVVTVRVSENRGGIGEQSFFLSVQGQAPAQIRGAKFNDLDGNGVRASEEPGLANWAIYLDQNGNGRRDFGESVRLTDVNGNYSFDNLLPGDYLVAEEAQRGFSQTAPLGGTYAVSVANGQIVAGLDFGNKQVAVVEEQPPFFVTEPITEAIASQTYLYEAAATDPNFDALSFDLLVKPAGMLVDPVTGVVIWEPTAAQVGVHDVVLRVSDGNGGSDEQSFQIIVSPANNPPSITSVPFGPALVGLLYQYQVRAQDADGDALTFQLVTAPSGMTLSFLTPQSSILSWTPTFSQIGTHAVAITVADGRGGMDAQSFDLAVAVANDAPAITSTPTAPAVVGFPYQYQARASDPNGDPLTFRLDVAPSGMVIDHLSGLLTWTATADQVGTNQVSIAVTDGRGGIATQSFGLPTVTEAVNDAPQITSSPPAPAVVGFPYRYQVEASDPNGDPLTFSLDTAPSGMTMDSQTGLVSYTATAGQVGNQPVAITVADGRGGFFTQSFDLPVVTSAPNDAPTIVSEPLGPAVVDAPYRYQVEATDVNGDLITFQLTTAPSGMLIDSATGLISWTPTAAQVGTQNVAVSASDGRGGVATQSFGLPVVTQTIANEPPSISSTPRINAAVGSLYLYAVVATDPNHDVLTYSLPIAPAGMTVDADGLIRWTPTSAQLGPNFARLEISDGRGAIVGQEFNVNVTTEFTNQPPIIVSNPTGSALVGDLYRYDAVASDPDHDPLTWTLVSGPAGMSMDSQLGSLRWTPNADQAGFQPAVIQVSDPFGGSSTQSFTVAVRLVNIAPSITSTPLTSAVVGKTYVYAVRATDPENDPLAFFLTSAPAGMTMDAGTGLILWTPTSAQAGSASVSVAVSDGQAFSSQNYSITVLATAENAPPVVTSTPPFFATVDTLYTYIVTAVDPESEPITFTLTEAPAGMTLTPVTNNESQITWTPSAADIGFHTVSIVVTDPHGAPSAQRFTIGVADPNNPNPPIADISNIAENQVVRDGLFDLVGIANDLDPTDAVSYQLSLFLPDGTFVRDMTPAPLNAQGFHVGRVSGGDNLATLDFTMLENGVYQLDLTVRGGNDFDSDTVTFALDSNLKVGQFGFSQQDLVIPVSGIPLSVIRTYNSLNPRDGDFGFSWTYSISDVEFTTDEFRVPAEDIDGTNFSLRDGGGRNITLTLPDGRRTTFAFSLTPGLSDASGVSCFCYQAFWTAPPGVYYTLQPTVSNKLIQLPGLTPFWEAAGLGTPMDAFDFKSFILTGKDGARVDRSGHRTDGFPLGHTATGGTRYVIEREDLGEHFVLTEEGASLFVHTYGEGKLTQVIDRNGNTTVISNDQIASFNALGDPIRLITFDRNPEGRIVAITDPLGAQMTYEYDSLGNLTSATDRVGNTTQYVYGNPSLSHYITEIIDPLGRTTARTEYDDNGRIIATIDAKGNRVEFNYDLSGHTQTIFNGLGIPAIYTYDTRGNVTERTQFLDGMAVVNHWIYDGNNNLLTHVDPLGNTRNYTYDSQGNVLSVTDPHGADQNPEEFTIRYTYDEFGNSTSVMLPTGAAEFSTYDSNGNLLAITNEDAVVLSSWTFDAVGNTTSETDAFGTFSYQYDSVGNNISFTDSIGNTITSTYDANGQITTMTDNGVTSTFQYDENGRETSSDYGNGITANYGYSFQDEWTTLDAPTIGHLGREFDETGRLGGWELTNGSTIDFDYNAAGQLTQQVDPMGNVTQYEYDDLGRVVSVVDVATGAVTTKEYDLANRVIRTTDAEGNSQTFSYGPDGRLAATSDANGNVLLYSYTLFTTSVTDPLGRTTTTEFSELGVPIRTINPDGTESSASYLDGVIDDPDEFPTSLVDEGGHVRSYTYDDVGRLSTATDLGGSVYNYNYGLDGLSSILGPTSETLGFTYDIIGNRSTMTFGDGGVQSYSYGANNLPSVVTLPSGETISLLYDDAGRTTSRMTSEGESATYSYNANDQVTVQQDNTGITSYTYDEIGNLQRIDYPTTASVEYGYDLLGRVISVTAKESPTALGYTTLYHYNEIGNLDQVTDPLGGVTTYEYDEVYRLGKRTLPNGIETTYEYNDSDQVTVIIHKDSGSNVIASLRYERQGIGEPSKITREDDSYVLLGYDNALRMTSEAYFDPNNVLIEQITYQYDDAGNRVGRTTALGASTYNYQTGFRLTAVDGPGSDDESYSYDSDGNTTAISRDGLNLMLTYDSYGHVTGVQGLAGGATETYTYDAMGRRVGIANGAGDIRNFLVAPTLADGLEQPYLVTDVSGAVQMGYAYVGETPLLRFDASGQPVYYLDDAMGSVIGLANASGQGVASFQYDGFGNPRVVTGDSAAPATIGGDFRFHGQWLDISTQLYSMRARTYDPQTGRFLSRDPIEMDQFTPEMMNFYIFANSNTHLFRDPSGLFSLIELNLTTLIQGFLQGIRALAVHEAKQYVKQQAFGAAGSFFVNSIASFVPGLHEFGSNLSSITGTDFEGIIKNTICGLAEPISSIIPIGVRFQVKVLAQNTPSPEGILRAGTPVSPGIGCSGSSEAYRNASNPFLRLSFTGGKKQRFNSADFVFRNGDVVRYSTRNHPVPQRPKGWAIGDSKRTAVTAYLSAKTNSTQWRAITAYASLYGSQQYIPFAFYVTLLRNSQNATFGRPQAIIMQSSALRSGTVVSVFSLFPVPSIY